jgi:hypothetical protein
MWDRLRRVLARLWRGRRTAHARARFWTQVREGQREAEAHKRLRP